MPTGPVPTVRIEAVIDLPWLLQAQGDGYGFGVRHPSAPVSVLGVPADGVAIAGVRTAISAVRDRRDWRVSEGAAVEWTDAENLGGNSASVRSAVSTGAAVGRSIPAAGRVAVGCGGSIGSLVCWVGVGFV